jgi:DNA-directed RNA polymerase subunit alpha
LSVVSVAPLGAHRARVVLAGAPGVASAPLACALRTALLTTLEGGAVTAVGLRTEAGVVAHEFVELPGVEETVSDVLLAAKQLRLHLPREGDHAVTLSLRGPRVVTSADIPEHEGLRLLTRDVRLCALGPGAQLTVVLHCRRGRGEDLAASRDPSQVPPDTLPIDALFSPVLQVHVAAGRGADALELELELETDGSITPELAVAMALGALAAEAAAPRAHEAQGNIVTSSKS